MVFSSERAQLERPLRFEPHLMRTGSATPPLFSHSSLDQPLAPVIELSDGCRTADGQLPGGFQAGARPGPASAAGLQERSSNSARRQGRRGLSPKSYAAVHGPIGWLGGAASPTADGGRSIPSVTLPRGVVFCPQAAPLSTPEPVQMWHHTLAPAPFGAQPSGFTS